MAAPAPFSLTFLHTPDPSYTIQGDGLSRVVLSPVFQTAISFDSFILSVLYQKPTNGWVLAEAQLCIAGKWSPFFKLAFYSKKISHSFAPQENEFASLQTDELIAKRPAQAYRFRLTLQGEMEVSKVVACISNRHATPPADAAVLPGGKCAVNVPSISQMQLAVPLAERKRLCSPTAISMALQALGVAADPLETAACVYDSQAKIYGNWTLNTAYAGTRGVEAYVTRLESLAQLAEHIHQNSLVAATISYKKGELTGAAVSQTPGHLVLLCGWENGKIRVADPAAPTDREVIRFYEAAEFARAWLINKAGVAYLVRKK